MIAHAHIVATLRMTRQEFNFSDATLELANLPPEVESVLFNSHVSQAKIKINGMPFIVKSCLVNKDEYFAPSFSGKLATYQKIFELQPLGIDTVNAVEWAGFLMTFASVKPSEWVFE